ncbi:HtaA domain-containing protein [Leucobacter triazinivorans]|uniref:Htaa domain-containing protein n=1 Tax=Leucobacter triazinivorans TaxID=1784719 RepID=A0A4P6KIS5_9MICO|nr:HtaA domain-containing protein [Leucobacter triazinivorans]QBE49484.1 hypothetical protein EVS81_12090 [Leucobacter triazinivorans]
MFARRGARRGLAAILVSALVAGGVFLGVGTAYAEELPAEPAAQEVATGVEQPAAPDEQAAPEPVEEAAPAPEPAAEPAAGPVAEEEPAVEEDPDAAEGAEDSRAESDSPAPTNEPAAQVARSVGPSVEVVGSVSDLDPAGDTVVTVRGSGFSPDTPGAAGTRPPLMGVFGGVYVVFGSFLEEWRPSEGVSSSARSVVSQKWAVLAENMAGIGGPDAGAVEMREDGSFETQLTLRQDEAKALADGRWGIYTYSGSGAKVASFETYTPVTFADPAPVGPSVEVVGSVSDLDPAGDTVVTVRGSGFSPDTPGAAGTRPPLMGVFGGVYVVFGSFLEEWRPSEGVSSSARSVVSQKWAVLAENMAGIGGPDAGAVEMREDGSFETQLTLRQDEAKALADGRWGIYTYSGSGAKVASFETYTPVTFADPAPPTFEPELEVFLADGTTEYSGQEVKEGDTLVVKGSGFDPFVNTCLPGVMSCELGGIGIPIPADKPQGTFAVFGHFAENWRPSNGVSSDQRKMDSSNRAWALAEETLENDVPVAYRDVIRSEWVELDPATGSFTWTVTLKEPADLVDDGRFGIYTYAGGVSSRNADHELAVLLNFAGKDRSGETDPEVAEGDLSWGIKESFRTYVEGGAGGAITLLGAAERASNGTFGFPQIAGGTWDPKTRTGEVRYAGGVGFSGHGGGLALTIADPKITVTSATRAVLYAKVDNSLLPIADIDLGAATRSGTAGAVTWTGALSTLRAEAVDAFLGFYPAGTALDPVTFTVGAASDAEPTKPVTPTPQPTPQPKPEPKPIPVDPSRPGAQQAGSLTWGVSSAFASYATGAIAKGGVVPNGVGGGPGGYVFPQAGSSWNATSQTGTVRYSGVVTFTGHNGLLNETFANPVVTVTSATTGSISAGGHTFGLDLGAASKSVGANGEVTWSGVPVSGAICGGGSTGGSTGSGCFAADPATFTVGAAGGVGGGAAAVTSQFGQKRTPAAAPPATAGITVITPEEELVPGGEIELRASGFEPDERDILVVLYSDPIVLDDSAGADANGDVRWIGTLPEDLEPGQHTITLQGSVNAGKVITVLDSTDADTQQDETTEISVEEAQTAQGQAVAAGPAENSSVPVWVWWIAALALLAAAGATSGLVVAQRRANGGDS